MADETNPGSSAKDIATLLADYVPKADYEAALEALQAATDAAETQGTAAETHAARVAELEKTVRGRTYRDTFNKLAKEAKLKDELADDAWELLKVAQDKDEPDEKAMKAALSEFLKAPNRKSYVNEDEPRKKTIPAGEGSARGRSTSPGDPEFHVSPKDLNNASWMLLNQGKMREADMAGLLVLDDD